MTKFSYSEVQTVHDSSQSARVACLSNFSMVESTLSDFTASNELTGPGWSAAKSALSPYSVVSKALYNYHCDFGETFTAFLASFEAEVGETSKVLDTDELIELQSKIHRIQQEKQELMVKIAGNIALEIIGGYGVMYKDYQIDQAQKKVDILEKYQSFESNHAGDFTSIASTGATLKTAFTELGKAKQFNQQTGMYTYSDCSHTDWYKTLSTYNDSCPSQRIEIVLTNRKYAENGVYLYEVYINGVYSKTASENLMYATSVEGTKALGLSVLNMAGEFTGIYDIYRFLSGKDPISGDKTSRLEAGLWTALLLLPTAKLVTAVKELKAGNKLLKGVDLTSDELRILTKAGYFDDVAKIGKIEKGNELLNSNLLDELAKSGVKYNPDDVIMITKTPEGKLLWLENGSSSAGLKHIVDGHAVDFTAKGVNDIPSFLNEVLQTTPIRTGSNKKGPFAEYLIRDNKYRVAYGTNGYIVSFYPID